MPRGGHFGQSNSPVLSEATRDFDRLGVVGLSRRDQYSCIPKTAFETLPRIRSYNVVSRLGTGTIEAVVVSQRLMYSAPGLDYSGQLCILINHNRKNSPSLYIIRQTVIPIADAPEGGKGV